ncbi:SGNH/GDSL hydrolase family protein [Pseudonocardia eucalypti]|uniref:SGNH/GDSL hydrolase family protein n=1 Tax=Pseudonocardia eucalypti TaxID=648755 RepID=A0ABP9RAS5_9PSEU|nr:lysophospholipase L1-like esterase [Pseudonocardia eucalypti]
MRAWHVWCSLAVSAIAISATPGVSAASPSLRAGTYVALGDSYTAGPLIPEQNRKPPGCRRSDHNYPSLVQSTLRFSKFTDVSCAGAKTSHMWRAQAVRDGVNQPQLDALRGGTSVVTVGVGGNDIDFGEIVQTCATKSPSKPEGAACKDFYTRGGTDQLAKRIADTAPKLAGVLTEVRKRVPRARVLVVGYPVILPDSGRGCYPALPFSNGDTAYLRDTTVALNKMIADEAAKARVEFLDIYSSSVGHDICQDTGVRWVEHFVPTSRAAPMHPNALGMRNAADQVLARLGQPVPVS